MLVHAVLSALLLHSVAAAPTRPNVVMLFVDDLGFNDVGFNGNPVLPTPNVDRLAFGGMRLRNWYIQSPTPLGALALGPPSPKPFSGCTAPRRGVDGRF